MRPAPSTMPARRDSTTGSTRRSRGDRGQVLALVAIALVAILAMVGLVIDGGNVFSQQRMTQNATDSAADAGATVIARNLLTGAESDADVLAAVQAAATANQTAVVDAQYTDISGTLISVAVGSAPGGSIPPGAAGVKVSGQRVFDAFVSRIVGIDTYTTRTDATAAAGSLVGVCPASSGCGVWPVTVPVTTVFCDGTGDPVLSSAYWPKDGTIVEVPLCRSGPGNVGWLDFHPPSGGSSELADTILHPDNDQIDIPDWYFVAETGNVNSSQVQAALRTYRDELVLLPLFSDTCNVDPGDGPTGPLPCPPGQRGNGQNLYYLFQAYAGFRVCGPLTPGCTSFGPGGIDVSQGAYITGNPSECSSGNGQTSCFFGRFEDIVFSGTIAASPGNPGGPLAVGVQLIK
jgi:Flp pilus assembly protein TadG